MNILQCLFSGLFDRLLIYFQLTAERYPWLWFWGFADIILQHYYFRLWGLQNLNTIVRIYNIKDKITVKKKNPHTSNLYMYSYLQQNAYARER